MCHQCHRRHRLRCDRRQMHLLSHQLPGQRPDLYFNGLQCRRSSEYVTSITPLVTRLTILPETLAFAQQFCGSAGVTITLPTAAAGTDTATSSLAAYTSTTTAPGSSSSVAVTSVTTIPAGYNPAIAGNNGTGISTVPSNSTASMAVTSTMATPSVTTTTSSTPEAFTGAAVLVTAGQWVVGGVAALGAFYVL